MNDSCLWICLLIQICLCRDRYIEQLLHQMEQLSTELLKTRHESQHQMGAMHKKVVDLENRLSEKETEVEEALKGKQDIENKLSEAAQSAQLGSVVQLQLQVGYQSMS